MNKNMGLGTNFFKYITRKRFAKVCLHDAPPETTKEYSNGLPFYDFFYFHKNNRTTVSFVGIAPLTWNRLNFMSLSANKTAALQSAPSTMMTSKEWNCTCVYTQVWPMLASHFPQTENNAWTHLLCMKYWCSLFYLGHQRHTILSISFKRANLST